MSSYALNTKLAREGAGGGGGRISETGKYIGMIEWAREVTFDSGAVAIEVKFVTNTEQSAQMKMFVKNPNKPGDSYGLKQLNALMTCAKVRGINGKPGKVKVYDNDSKSMIDQDSVVFPELQGKPVGFLLQKEYYPYNGEQKYQMNIFAPFTVDTEQSAREVLDGKGEALDLEKMVDHLKDKYREGTPQIKQASQHANYSTAPNSAPNAADDFDDDIPF